MSKFLIFVVGIITISNIYAAERLQSIQVFNNELRPGQIQLKNDSMSDEGGQGYVQMGFIKGEKAGVWVEVPKGIKKFKVDFFRTLVAGSLTDSRLQVFFQMQLANAAAGGIGAQIENAAEITPGPYWNDIPAQGLNGGLPCASGGEFVGAALEFTHEGLPSVFRDLDGISHPTHNQLFAIPGGWKPSVAFGLQGDWILRIVGHEATPEECKS